MIEIERRMVKQSSRDRGFYLAERVVLVLEGGDALLELGIAELEVLGLGLQLRHVRLLPLPRLLRRHAVPQQPLQPVLLLVAGAPPSLPRRRRLLLPAPAAAPPPPPPPPCCFPSSFPCRSSAPAPTTPTRRPRPSPAPAVSPRRSPPLPPPN